MLVNRAGHEARRPLTRCCHEFAINSPELHAIEVNKAMWPTVLSFVAAGCLTTTLALAGTTPEPDAAQPSLSHSALKATTFKAGTTVVNLSILSYALGGVIGGASYTA